MNGAKALLACLVIAGVLVLAAAIGAGFGERVRLLLSGGALGAIVVAAVVYLATVQRPLRELAGSARAAPSSGPPGDMPPGGVAGDIEEIASRLDRLARQNRALEESLASLEADRARALAAQRDAEERYALAVERANDGVWECLLESGTTNFSTRWQSMLSRLQRPPENLESWLALVHHGDRDAVRMLLDDYLAGQGNAFEAEYRIACGDGQVRWIRSRGTALRRASGKPYRLLVQDNDVYDRKTLETTLIQAAEGMSMLSGEELFRNLAQTLSALLGTRDNLVCLCEGDPPTRARVLAYFTRGSFTRTPFEYDLAGTSCGDVIARGDIVYCPTGVCDLWPIERQYDRDSYLGVPMFDSNGKVIGHFACMDGKPMRQDMPHLALFRLFAVRAASELERMLLKEQLARAPSPPPTPAV
jgi:PAS domain S-box-containing protein